jgi:hypothetical protein
MNNQKAAQSEKESVKDKECDPSWEERQVIGRRLRETPRDNGYSYETDDGGAQDEPGEQ